MNPVEFTPFGRDNKRDADVLTAQSASLITPFAQWRRDGMTDCNSKRFQRGQFPRTCAHCGVEFTCGYKVESKGRFCSRKCRYRFKASLPSVGVKTKTCQECGQSFEHPIGRGTDRNLCSDFCRTSRRHAKSKTKPLCVVEGCRQPRAYGSGICNACYCRLRRTGTLEKRVWKYRSLGTNGYIRVFDKDHPLASSDGYVLEHRKVLYDTIGVGPHPCYWCKKSFGWEKNSNNFNVIVPDHLNGDKTDNALVNLVPSCQRCNIKRGAFMVWVSENKHDPVLWGLYQASLHREATGS